jgi:hypothetical protein
MVRHPVCMGSADWAELLASARSVRVVAGPTFDEQHRSHQHTLLVESAADAIRDLRVALQIEPDSLAEQLALMTPGDVTVALFADGHSLVTTVTYIHPGYLRWRPWGADARLADPSALPGWLSARGWEPPAG